MHRFLALILALVSTPLAADNVVAGFESLTTSYPVGARIRNLSDGTTVTCNGINVQHWTAGGTLINTLGTFAVSGQTGAFVVDPSETFVLVGLSNTGEMLKVDLGGGGTTSLGPVPGNGDAAFDSPTTAIVSAGICGSGCGNALVRLDTNSGATTVLAALDGIAGPVALDNAGDLYYGTQSGTFPIPAGASSILRYTSAQLASPPTAVFQPDRELIVVEIESTPPAGNWTVSTALPGFTGASYYRWDGPDLFGSPGSGIIRYDFEVVSGGNYIFHMHNRHNDPAPDQDNDCWVRVNGGSWDKVYSNFGSGSVGVWNWWSYVDPPSGADFQANYTLSAGRHFIEFSGRSNGYHLDRFLFYKNYPKDPFDLTNPESTSASYNVNQTTTVAAGFNGASEMVHDPVQDQLLLAVNHVGFGTNTIRTITPAGAVGTLVTGDPFHTIASLDFQPGAGAPFFFKYQPASGGALGYTRKGPGVSEHRAVVPDRPTLAISGPGSITGTGNVTIDVQGAIPGGLALLAYSPTLGGSEFPIFIGGQPLIHTSLGLATTSLLPTPLFCDGNGDASFGFVNNLGAPDLLGVQAVVLDGLGAIVGSSTTDLL